VTRTARPQPPVTQPAGLARIAGLLLVIVALLAACSPATGALGSPAAPAATPEPSVAAPSGDATPDTSSQPPESPSASPGGSPDGSGSPSSPSPTPTTRPSPTPIPATGTTILRAYFILGSFTGNAGLAPVLRVVPETKAVASAAVRQLLGGPQGDEVNASPAFYTTIPDGARLLGLSIDGGVATINLSREFASGGGGESIRGRLAQVVYTLTQFSTVDAVTFQLDGQPTSSLGGVDLSKPVGRDDFHDQLPAIFVDRPAWEASIGNPGTVSGVANTFEATFRVQVVDGSDKVLVDKQVMASCGTGCWGTFSTSVSYTVSRAQWGTLRVFELSAKDGSETSLTEYPVWLTKA
jgi:hypothetical protein